MMKSVIVLNPGCSAHFTKASFLAFDHDMFIAAFFPPYLKENRLTLLSLTLIIMINLQPYPDKDATKSWNRTRCV